MTKQADIPTLSKTVMMPDPFNGEAGNKEKRVSIASSIISDTTTENGDTANLTVKKTKFQRRRQRLSQLLHTHVILILVCALSALDAVCVIGQIICDILIMKDSLNEWKQLDSNLTSLLWQEIPHVLNTTGHDSPDDLDLYTISDILWKRHHGDQPNITALYSQLVAAGILEPSGDVTEPSRWVTAAGNISNAASQMNTSINETFSPHTASRDVLGMSAARGRTRRAAKGLDGEYTLLYHLTHAFHLGSMVILSVLLLECFLKVFAMGKKLLHHKLEVFDIFVVSVSWSLDVAFWEGIWAHPDSDAATILIVMLPWRVIRIVNSFVLVIQEKDHVELKIVKQKLRLSARKGKEANRKTSSYKTEVKQLRGLCRKYGATENEINACTPAVCVCGREVSTAIRSRKTLKTAKEHNPSLTLLNGLNCQPIDGHIVDSSSEEDDVIPRQFRRSVSQDPSLPSTPSVHDTSHNENDIGGLSNPAFASDETSQNGTTNNSKSKGFDRQDSLTRL